MQNCLQAKQQPVSCKTAMLPVATPYCNLFNYSYNNVLLKILYVLEFSYVYLPNLLSAKWLVLKLANAYIARLDVLNGYLLFDFF